MNTKTRPTKGQARFLDRLAVGEPFEEAAKDFRTAKTAQASLGAMRRRGWLDGERLTPAGAEAVGHNPEPWRLPPPPPVVIERVTLPPIPKRLATPGPNEVLPDRADEAAENVGAPPPAPEHKTEAGQAAQALHDQICAKVREAERAYMALAALVHAAYVTRAWEFFGFAAPEAYFELSVGLKIRTVLALKAIHEGVLRLPEPERPRAIAALSEIGRHKATVLAPVLGNSEASWEQWVETARALTEAKLQAQVSHATGAQPRGGAAVRPDPGQAFMERVVGGLPPTHQRKAQVVWTLWDGFLATLAGRAEPFHPIAGFLAMIERAEAEMAEQGVEIRVDDA